MIVTPFNTLFKLPQKANLTLLQLIGLLVDIGKLKWVMAPVNDIKFDQSAIPNTFLQFKVQPLKLIDILMQLAIANIQKMIVIDNII